MLCHFLEVSHLASGFFEVHTLVFHVFLFLLQLLNSLYKLLPFKKILLLKLQHFLFRSSELLLCVIVFFFKIFLVISFCCDVFDVLLVVGYILLQFEDSLVIFLFEGMNLVVQFIYFLLLAVYDGHVLLFVCFHFFLVLAAFLLEFDHKGLHVIQIIRVLVLFKLFLKLADGGVLIDDGVKGCLFDLVEITG